MTANSESLPDPSPFLKRLMRDVAPEKASELQKWLDDLGVTFTVNDAQHRIYFTASAKLNRIEFGLRCVWRLWANAFAYFCIYDEVRSAKLADPSASGLDLQTTPRLRKATELLRHAVITDVETKVGNASPFDVVNLPKGLPVPFSPSPYASDEHVADELALMAIGFILHHELAHLRLGHRPCEGYESIRQEKEADMAAADWLLDSEDLDPRARLKRELSVAVGLGWFASLNIYISFTGNTHPPAYDRLYQVLDQHVEDPNSPVWAMVVTLLGLHLQNQEVEYGQEIEFGSFKECANHYVNVISRIKP